MVLVHHVEHRHHSDLLQARLRRLSLNRFVENFLQSVSRKQLALPMGIECACHFLYCHIYDGKTRRQIAPLLGLRTIASVKVVVMNKSLARAFVAAASLAPFCLVFESKARAAEWGCQVILCLSNPSGPTQYAECRAPIHRLWRALARGRSFPTCSGVGFQTSRPRYDPYYCNDGYRLTTRYGDHGLETSCISTTPQTVSNAECYSNDDRMNSSAAWRRRDGRTQCQRYVTTRPNIRPQPHSIDVIIDGVGKQRVWY